MQTCFPYELINLFPGLLLEVYIFTEALIIGIGDYSPSVIFVFVLLLCLCYLSFIVYVSFLDLQMSLSWALCIRLKQRIFYILHHDLTDHYLPVTACRHISE